MVAVFVFHSAILEVMKGIAIGGVEYLPASALAKQFKYTTDYIGQLCRGKKIDAQLVGRSWYVNPESLTAHKEGRYAGVRSGSKAAAKLEVTESKQEEKGYKVTLSRLDVEPVVTKNASKMATEVHHNFAKRIDWKPLKYEIDEAALLPQLREEAPPRRVQVDLAEASELAIKTSTKTTNLVAEELPTVSLKGKVSVVSIDEDFKDTEPEPALPVPEPVVLVRKVQEKPMLHHAALPKSPNMRPLPLRSIPKPQSGMPGVGKTDMVVQAVVEESTEVIPPSSRYLWLSLIFACVVLGTLLLVTIFAESTVTASATTYTSGIHFSTESIFAFFTQLSQ